MFSLEIQYRQLLQHYKSRYNTLRCFLRTTTAKFYHDLLEERIPKINYTTLQPKEQNLDQIGMWYRLNPQLANHLFNLEGLTKKLKELNADIFRETSFMIRQPALQMIDFIKKSNLSISPNRFIFYGRKGVGKTVSLSHVIHYLVEEGFILVHVAVPARWFTLHKEILPSLLKEDWFDHTVDSSIWLQQFKSQNELLLKTSELVTQETYKWTQREETPEGSPLTNLIEFGISRPRYAAICVYHLINELKKLANLRKIKLAFACDGINALYSSKSNFLREDKSSVSNEYFTLIQAFLQLIQRDWTGGVIVGSVDIVMSTKERRDSHYPRYLLGKKGWTNLDPLVPIAIEEYNELEFESALNYYIVKRWIQHPAAVTVEGKEELAFMSGKNGAELLRRADVH